MIPFFTHILTISILFMHIFDQPTGERVICAGGQSGEILLGFYDKGMNNNCITKYSLQGYFIRWEGNKNECDQNIQSYHINLNIST